MDLEALLSAARDGKPEAWDELHKGLSRELRVYFRREFDESTADELTDRTVEILAENLRGFEPEKKSLRKWVFGIARNQGLLEHRARRQDNKALSELAAQVMKTPNTSPTAERICAKEKLIAILLEEIEKLPSHLRRVVEHDLESATLATPKRRLSLEEFARQEAIQPATVWSRRFRAITMLRDRLMARLKSRPTAVDSTSSSSSSPA
jgi:RNA polymerase sigma-70 factor (ECF subfamily)